MAFVSVYFSLGTNMGRREENISRALELLDDAMECHWTSLSHIIETRSWGFNGPKFLNAAVMYRIFRQPVPAEQQAFELLDKIKSIESRMGREGEPVFDPETGKRIYENRIIDIDILFFGDERIDNPRLTVPHKLISERDFVLFPLREIAKPSLKASFPEYF